LVEKSKLNRISLIAYVTLFVIYGLLTFERIGRVKLFKVCGTLEEFSKKYEDMVKSLEEKRIFELLSS